MKNSATERESKQHRANWRDDMEEEYMIIRVIKQKEPQSTPMLIDKIPTYMIHDSIVLGRKDNITYKLTYSNNPDCTYNWIGFNNTMDRWSDDTETLINALYLMDEIRIVSTIDEMVSLIKKWE